MVKSKASFANASKRPNQKLNITSLMDVLTIILIFLLVNYSSEEEKIELPDFIKIPTVKSRENSENEGVPIFIGKNKLSIGKEKFITYSSFMGERDRIMEDVQKYVDSLRSQQKDASKPLSMAISADEDIPYRVVNSIVVSLGEIGITNMDFLALKKKD